MRTVALLLCTLLPTLFGTAVAETGGAMMDQTDMADMSDLSIADIVAANPDFAILNLLIQTAGLTEALSGGNYTVFAPADEAFVNVSPSAIGNLLADREMLAAVLSYHVVPNRLVAAAVRSATVIRTLEGEELTIETSIPEQESDEIIAVDGVPITQPDILASNGVIHVIGGLLMPASLSAETTPETTPETAPATTGNTIADLVLADPQFSTLATALEAAGLVETLSAGNFTVFAPTNDAFAAIPEADLDALLADREALTAVLLYHVVPVRLAPAALGAAETLRTVQGGGLTRQGEAGALTVNESAAIAGELEADNGYIYIIDAVLMPEME